MAQVSSFSIEAFYYLTTNQPISTLYFEVYISCGVTEPPPPMASRSLIMVAKCLQNLANLVEFGGKEPYMEVVNPFILKNKERMVVFLDQLSVSRVNPRLIVFVEGGYIKRASLFESIRLCCLLFKWYRNIPTSNSTTITHSNMLVFSSNHFYSYSLA